MKVTSKWGTKQALTAQINNTAANSPVALAMKKAAGQDA